MKCIEKALKSIEKALKTIGKALKSINKHPQWARAPRLARRSGSTWKSIKKGLRKAKKAKTATTQTKKHNTPNIK